MELFSVSGAAGVSFCARCFSQRCLGNREEMRPPSHCKVDDEGMPSLVCSFGSVTTAAASTGACNMRKELGLLLILDKNGAVAILRRGD
jgi:hypothetical protein